MNSHELDHFCHFLKNNTVNLIHVFDVVVKHIRVVADTAPSFERTTEYNSLKNSCELCRLFHLLLLEKSTVSIPLGDHSESNRR